ncbi:Aldehyde dehydrogenase [Cupriavidus necator]|uniref:Aldehyde dehydrogenase n=1 Tax=Cupriavidus necator TaxID=106590 RepID=A0A1K0JJD2_CUPNE|nr:Aldehyde dehydrogenase [Cupriavidus necator]
MKSYQMFIDGEFVDAVDGRCFASQNPYTGDAWARVPSAGSEDVARAVDAADRAWREGPWGQMTATERGALLWKLGDLIARDAGRLAETEVRDNGKLMAEMLAQVRYLTQWFRYFGGLADKIEGTVPPLDKPGYFQFTRNEPLGVVAVITPWNSPLMLLAWKVAPALAAGCTVVVKPSEFTSASTLELASLFLEAGFPRGVFNVITGFGAEAGASLVTDRRVRKVTFTGSDATGRLINQQCAAQFKHVSLELGGKSPNIVFDDADLDAAVAGAISGIFAASGQTCIAGSRLLLQESIHDVFVERLLATVTNARLGDPMLPTTQVGPITTPAQYDKVLSYIDIARQEGATCVLGGKPSDIGGLFVEPTVFTDVTPAMRIAQEEVFGPVLAVIRFRDESEAIEIANGTAYGLGAGVWTRDIGRAFRVSRQIEAGTVWVNTYRAVSFMSPFGGYKDSGIGRENGIGAIREYLQTKSVWINTEAPPANPFTIR